ncbi:MAG: hypothetical protein IIT37_04175, partial [Bacteroidales bacterium]|nr:hypothetical protein [Bacteroidales bacterium]
MFFIGLRLFLSQRKISILRRDRQEDNEKYLFLGMVGRAQSSKMGIKKGRTRGAPKRMVVWFGL